MLSAFSGFYITTATAFPENPGTYTYFMKICDVPFKDTEGWIEPEQFFSQNYGDCDDRALAFRKYLENKGAKNVQYGWVTRVDRNGNMIPDYKGYYGHVFVLWNDKVFSPSNNSTNPYKFYNRDIKSYQQNLKKNSGYNMWYTEKHPEGEMF